MIVCEKCSTELPADAVACYRCGTMTDVTFVRPIAAPVGKSNQGLMIAGIASVVVLAAAIVIAAMVVSNRASDQAATNRVTTTPANTDVQSKTSQTPKSATPAPTQPPAVENVPPPAPTPDKSVVRIDENVTSKAWIPFNVRGAKGTVSGRLEGSGGIRGEFDVYIMTDQQLTDYRNGHTDSTIYGSKGKVVQDISVELPQGTYFLVLINPGMVSRRITGSLRISN